MFPVTSLCSRALTRSNLLTAFSKRSSRPILSLSFFSSSSIRSSSLALALRSSATISLA